MSKDTIKEPSRPHEVQDYECLPRLKLMVKLVAPPRLRTGKFANLLSGTVCLFSSLMLSLLITWSCFPSKSSTLFSVFGFLLQFNTSDVSFTPTRLYERTPAVVLCPVRCIISCSSTPASNNLVAAVARREWWVKWPCSPAEVHKRLTTIPTHYVRLVEVETTFLLSACLVASSRRHHLIYHKDISHCTICRVVRCISSDPPALGSFFSMF